MFKIEGKENTAICFAKEYEEYAVEQIRRMCDYNFTKKSKIRIMPDMHVGKGCTIGTTMTITDKIVPNLVGVDIGCGMYTVSLGPQDIDLKKVDEAAYGIPSGMNVWEEAIETFDLEKLRCFEKLRKINYMQKSLGTLGGGNHFIEIDQGIDGEKYLVIHSGSRYLGKQVAEYYQNLAIENHKGKKEALKKREEIIEQYKKQGRQNEIQKALEKLNWKKRKTEIPEDLCYLEGKDFDDYLHDVEICQQYAKRNRELIAKVLLKKIGVLGKDEFHTIHNYIDTHEMILRKGAISANKGQKVLIPINMRDGSVLATGRGNAMWNYSAPHGAGRVMSRFQAKKNLNMADYKESMNGIYTTSVNEYTIDEAPMAYKSIEDIIEAVKESVDIIEIIKPIYNFKAS